MVTVPLAFEAYSIICSKQRPNSSKTRPSVSTELLHNLSASSAWASKHWHVASTTSCVMKLNGGLLEINQINQINQISQIDTNQWAISVDRHHPLFHTWIPKMIERRTLSEYRQSDPRFWDEWTGYSLYGCPSHCSAVKVEPPFSRSSSRRDRAGNRSGPHSSCIRYICIWPNKQFSPVKKKLENHQDYEIGFNEIIGDDFLK